MRESFREYYPLSQDEYKLIWNKAIIVFDTNVLLNFYRYSETTFKRFIDILANLSNKVWIPFQVASEFHSNRLNVIESQVKIYFEYKKKLEELQKEFENKTKNPFISNLLLSEVNITFDKIKKELSEKEQYFQKLITNDVILETITAIFDKKIGDSISTEEFESICQDGEKRYKNNIPPGFKDYKKNGKDKYGDLILWMQIIEKAKKDKCPILFITDDSKDDWWSKSQGKTICPNYDLRREFYNKTGELFYMYRAFNFLEYAQSIICEPIDLSVIEEVKQFTFNEQIIYVEINNDPYNGVDKLIEMISNDGYEVLKQNVKNDKLILKIILPNINDIFRRFKKQLQTYSSIVGIEIINVFSEDYEK